MNWSLFSFWVTACDDNTVLVHNVDVVISVLRDLLDEFLCENSFNHKKIVTKLCLFRYLFFTGTVTQKILKVTAD